MCMGAALNARIRKVYFGAYEQKGRSMTKELAASNLLNHTVGVEGGVLEEECSQILSGFFRAMRERTAAKKRAEGESAGGRDALCGAEEICGHGRETVD